MPQEKQTDSVQDPSPDWQTIYDRHADFVTLAREAEAREDWKSAAHLYSLAVEQRTAELALINSVQDGLNSKLDMQEIYTLVGDKLRDTFNAQIVMISQYDPATNRVYHHYAIESGDHINITGWHPIDSSRYRIIQTRKPFVANLGELLRLVAEKKMSVIPGTQMPKTWMGVPMLVGEEAKGVVSLQNLDKENAFSPSDIDLLTTLTNSMTLSLENARLFNETQRLYNLVEQEMAFARHTQHSILPLELPSRTGFDFGALIQPARAVGGDFYDFIHLNHDKLCIVIGDVSDKGMPAALVMALTFSLIRAETERSQNPIQVLRSVNRHLLRMNAANMFVTLLYCILDCKTGEFSFVRAGHLPPILIDPDGHVLDLPLDEGQSLGVFESPKLVEQKCVLPPDGMLLIYSDGLTEASDSSGVEFGVDRVKQELVDHRKDDAQAICERLWQAVQTYSGELLYQDDFTAVVIKRM